MILGNIIYENELINHITCDYIKYYNEEISHNKVNSNIPTLYVGWEYLKRCNPNVTFIQNCDILNRNIIPNKLYFEFSFDEYKSSHVKGVEEFSKNAPYLYFNSEYKYVNFDLIFQQLNGIDDVLATLPIYIDATYQYKNDMIYVLSGNDIIGINLILFRFFNIDTVELINSINNRTSFIYLDYNGDMYQQHYKKMPNFSELKRYLVVMLKLSNF